ncbi:MAG TPA: hypothetical protein VGN32_00300 [Ktedonobacterales bacterium]|nr:hypothetical protein [Ktedonobacterales bacterium]
MRRRFYVAILVAMALADWGAAFDVSYHFGHVFDEFSFPHLAVAVGVGCQVALLLYALVYRRDRLVAVERVAITVALVALVIDLVDIPLDLLWHLIFGIDATTWSPTHLLFNYPTDLIVVVLVVAQLASPAARGRGAWLLAFGYFLRAVVAVHFPLYQQEIGAVALDGLNRAGKAPWYVQPELRALAGPHARQLVMGGAPAWLYPIYFALALSYALTVGRVVLAGWRGTTRTHFRWPWPFGVATALAAGYLVWRIGLQTLYLAIHGAYTVVPWYLLGMGLVVDIVLTFGPRPIAWALAAWRPALLPREHLVAAALAGVAAALALYTGMALMGALRMVVPPAPLAALPFACVSGAAGALLGMGVGTRVSQLLTSRAEPPAASPDLAARRLGPPLEASPLGSRPG